MQVKPGSIVRVASILSASEAQHLFATVLTVAPSVPELLGADGEPTIAIAYLKPSADINVLGSSNWHNAFTRESNVAHASHADVKSGKRGIYWIDVLPEASTGLDEADLPELTTGESTVYSREKAEAFFAQDAKTVPAKVEPAPQEAAAVPPVDPTPSISSISSVSSGTPTTSSPSGPSDVAPSAPPQHADAEYPTWSQAVLHENASSAVHGAVQADGDNFIIGTSSVPTDVVPSTNPTENSTDHAAQPAAPATTADTESAEETHPHDAPASEPATGSSVVPTEPLA